MIRVISTKEGYFAGGRANPAAPVYFEEGFLTHDELMSYKRKTFSEERPHGPIILDLDMPDPGPGFTIHRIPTATARDAEKAPALSPVDRTKEQIAALAAAADNPPKRRGRPAKSETV